MEQSNKKNFVERRKYSRKTCFFAEVDYAAKNGIYTDSIKNISNGGVFIETDKILNIGDDITMLFADLARIDLIQVVGDIIRIMPSGIAIKFAINDDIKKESMQRYIDMV